MVTERFECERHRGTWLEVGETKGCKLCLRLLEVDVATLTGGERAAELDSWLNNRTTIPFDLIHQRIEALVGRPVFTHEMGLAADRLRDEARGTRRLTSIDEVVNDLRNIGKPVIEVEMTSE